MRTGSHQIEETAEIPDWFDGFEDYVKCLMEYRELLSAIIRLTAALLPEHALEVAPALKTCLYLSLLSSLADKEA